LNHSWLYLKETKIMARRKQAGAAAESMNPWSIQLMNSRQSMEVPLIFSVLNFKVAGFLSIRATIPGAIYW
jgi:hypothetical protein